MLALGDSALRKEADAMTFVGCDLHTRTQQVAVLDTRTGEVSEHQLVHDGGAGEEFYAALPRPVTVGIESTGYAVWFHTLMQRLGHTLLVGEAAKIRAMVVRKTKTDRRDALHILDLLRHDRFPTIWVPDPATRDLRALLTHRMRLVRIRTMVKNGLHAIALNYRLARGSKLLRRAGLAELQTLALPPHTTQRRDHSLQLLVGLNAQIRELDDAITTAALAHPDAPRLITHPGVGALTALATIVVLGPVARFLDSKHVVSYDGLAPALNASATLPNRAARSSASPSVRPRRMPPGWMSTSSAPTSPSCIGAGAPKPRSRSPGSCSCDCSSCCATRSTTMSSAAAGSNARHRFDVRRSRIASVVPSACVPVWACSG
jgi:transposase